jgi:hypothetical protein
LSEGVAVAAGCSIFVSGAVVVVGFRVVDRTFLSVFVAAGDSVAAGSFSFMAAASVFGATAVASVFGPSVFGGRVALGLISAGAFFSDVGFFAGDSAGVGS